MEHIIKYYPVGNADCTLIKLDDYPCGLPNIKLFN